MEYWRAEKAGVEKLFEFSRHINFFHFGLSVRLGTEMAALFDIRVMRSAFQEPKKCGPVKKRSEYSSSRAIAIA